MGYKYNNIVRPLLVKYNIVRFKVPTGSGLTDVIAKQSNSAYNLYDFLKKLVSVYTNIDSEI